MHTITEKYRKWKNRRLATTSNATDLHDEAQSHEEVDPEEARKEQDERDREEAAIPIDRMEAAEERYREDCFTMGSEWADLDRERFEASWCKYCDAAATCYVQGETYSFGTEWWRLCDECAGKASEPGQCERCGKDTDRLRPVRDWGESCRLHDRVDWMCAECGRKEHEALTPRRRGGPRTCASTSSRKGDSSR
jgi:hypothetical protein